jgi:hypothetical protein
MMSTFIWNQAISFTWPAGSSGCEADIFSPQIPSAQCEGNLRRKNVQGEGWPILVKEMAWFLMKIDILMMKYHTATKAGSTAASPVAHSEPMLHGMPPGMRNKASIIVSPAEQAFPCGSPLQEAVFAIT